MTTAAMDRIQRDGMGLHVGDLVRYTRTGTVGEIIGITQEDGVMFAELDSTNLLYRVDTLTPISTSIYPHIKKDPNDQDIKRKIEAEIKKTADNALHDTTGELDSACAGAG
jgi:hypothetical protein